eukprot:9453565-Alexandrium_andersonii.AAC.1
MDADAMPPPAVTTIRGVPAVPVVPHGTVVDEADRDAIVRQAQKAMSYAASAEPAPAGYVAEASALMQ